MIPLHDNNPTKHFPWMTLLIIGANVFVFLYWQLGTGLERSIQMAAFIPADAHHYGIVAETPSLVMSMFMHGGFMHLIGNMWFLWLFGNNVEDRCGSFSFFVFYLACGIAATLGYASFNPNSHVPLVGASGAISGVLGAYVVMFPHAEVLTLVPLGFFTRLMYLPAWIFLGIWIGFQFLSQAMTSASRGGGKEQGGVAFLAHIAGFAVGAVLIFIFRRR